MTVTVAASQVERIVAMLNKGQVEFLRALLADDIIWRVPHTHPLAADVTGIDGVIAFLRRVSAETDRTFCATPLEISISGSAIFCLMRVTASRLGKQLDQRVVSIWRIRDGKISERDIFMEDTAAADEFWSY